MMLLVKTNRKQDEAGAAECCFKPVSGDFTCREIATRTPVFTHERTSLQLALPTLPMTSADL